MVPRVGPLGAALLLVLVPAVLVGQEEIPQEVPERDPRPRGAAIEAPQRDPPSPRPAPPAGTGQERSCRQVLPADARRLFNARGQELIYFRDPVRVLCTGGLLLEADSAVMNRTVSSVELIGNVVYEDTLRELTSDWANYIGARNQLLARGDVVLRNLEDGSVVEGEQLEYLQATATRPQARMLVRGGRPYALIPPQPDSAGGAADTTASTEVWAERMVFVGEEVFRGAGNVEIRRGEMTGGGETAVFDQAAERMTLTDGAHVETEEYRLDGDEIVAYLDGRELRTVTSVGAARVESEQLLVDSERIRIGFAGGELERMEAWNPEPDSVPRALADAGDFLLRADSIDARADSVGLQEVRAVGRAYGERGADSMAVRVAESIRRDWIQGDTILVFFAHRGRGGPGAPAGQPATGGGRPEPGRDSGAVGGDRLEETSPYPGGLPQDTAGAAPPLGTGPARGPAGPLQEDSVETVLERIVVIGAGGTALSLYRMPADQGGESAAINFLKANRITLFMERGDVARVDAEGPLDGLYLAPAERTGDGASEVAEPGEGEDGGEPARRPGGEARGGPGGRP